MDIHMVTLGKSLTFYMYIRLTWKGKVIQLMFQIYLYTMQRLREAEENTKSFLLFPFLPPTLSSSLPYFVIFITTFYGSSTMFIVTENNTVPDR